MTLTIINRPGPSYKQYAFPNACAGVVLHSAEGYLPGMLAVLDGPAAKSVTFFVDTDGTVYRFYPDEASTWASGNQVANMTLIPIEHAGVAGEPLTPPQLTASVDLVRMLSVVHHFPLVRGGGLYEHREVWNWSSPNAGPTACPSGRIPWEHYTMPDTMPRPLSLTTPEDRDVRAIISAMANGRVIPVEFDQDGRAVYRLVVDLPALP